MGLQDLINNSIKNAFTSVSGLDNLVSFIYVREIGGVIDPKTGYKNKQTTNISGNGYKTFYKPYELSSNSFILATDIKFLVDPNDLVISAVVIEPSKRDKIIISGVTYIIIDFINKGILILQLRAL